MVRRRKADVGQVDGGPKELRGIRDLVPDPRNPNAHTERGSALLSKSLSELGAGRGIVASADGVVLAGNGVLEEAASIGLDVEVVQTDGRELVVVQRVDMLSTDPEALALKIADNRTSEVGLEWDLDVLNEARAAGLLDSWWGSRELDAMLGPRTEHAGRAPARDARSGGGVRRGEGRSGRLASEVEERSGSSPKTMRRSVPPPHGVSGPMAITAGVLARLRERTNKVLVGFTGGKDSLCVLDLMVRGGFDVTLFFMYSVPGLECVERWFRWARETYGLGEVVQVPHPSAVTAARYGFYGPRMREFEALPRAPYRSKDAIALARKRTGIEWAVDGIRASDSPMRRVYLRAHAPNGLGEADHRAHPIWPWKPDDVRAYLAIRRMPRPEVKYGTWTTCVGPKGILYLYDHHRDDYERMRVVFPQIDRVVARRAFYPEFGGKFLAAKRTARAGRRSRADVEAERDVMSEE